VPPALVRILRSMSISKNSLERSAGDWRRPERAGIRGSVARKAAPQSKSLPVLTRFAGWAECVADDSPRLRVQNLKASLRTDGTLVPRASARSWHGRIWCGASRGRSGLAPEEIDPAGWRAMVGGSSQRRAMHLGRTVVSATSNGARVKVRLDDGSERNFDHVFLGTGYRVDVSKYDFLAPKLAGSISRHQGSPALQTASKRPSRDSHILGAPPFGASSADAIRRWHALFFTRAMQSSPAKRQAVVREWGEPLVAGLELSRPHD